MLAPRLKRLRDISHAIVSRPNSCWLERVIEMLAGQMLKWWGLLMTNIRMLVLFALSVHQANQFITFGSS